MAGTMGAAGGSRGGEALTSFPSSLFCMCSDLVSSQLLSHNLHFLWFDGNSINEFGYDPVSTDKSVTNSQPELLHKQTDIDTVSSKALDLSQIRVEWIEE
jgi:hypothetical protein